MSCWPWSHRWSKWEPYAEKGKRPGAPATAGFLFIDERERRRCAECGATQDRRIVLKDTTRFAREA